jgi:hypothetical protein
MIIRCFAYCCLIYFLSALFGITSILSVMLGFSIVRFVMNQHCSESHRFFFLFFYFLFSVMPYTFDYSIDFDLIFVLV